MKTKILSLITLLLVSAFGAFGQVTLMSESFETDGEGSRYTSNTAGSCNDFFQRVNSKPSCFGNNITNTDGSFYMASEDVVDRPGGGSADITFNNVNISGYSSLTVSLRIATSGGSPSGAWERTDHVFIEYAIDGNIGANNYTTVGLFNGQNILPNNSGFLRVDTDNNPGTFGPFGTTLSTVGVLTTVPFNIPSTGGLLSIRIRNTQDGGSEELAYDLIEVKGVLAVNDAPVLANIEGAAINYTEGDAATQVSNSITISDTEGDNITSATVEVSAGFEVGEDVLTFTPLTGVSGSQTGNTLTLSGSKTLAEYQTLLRSVKYQNTNVINPSVTTRTIRFRVSDGGNSNFQTRNITITPVVNPPTALPVTESFETDGEGTRYTSNTFNSGCNFFIRTNTTPACHADAISGADGSFYWASEDARSSDLSGNPSLPAATVELSPLIATGNNQFTIDVLLGVSGNSAGDKFELNDAILVQYNFDGSGWTTVGAFYGDTLGGGHMRQDTNLNGSGDGTFLTTVLQNFQFGIIGSGTDLNVRVVVDQVGGNEEIVFDKITVAPFVPVNVSPVLANVEGTPLNYVEGSGAQQVTNTITVTDAESDDITSATITVSQGFDASEDVLSFTSQFAVTGSYTGGTLTLNGPATPVEYQTLLRSVTYQNTDSTDPSLQDRTIQFQVNNATASNFETRVINIDASLQTQNIPACESLETDGNGQSYSAYGFDDGSNYWLRFDASGAKYPQQAEAITGATGDFIWIGEDVDEPTNPNPSGLGEMLLNPFNASSFSSFTISINLATSSPLKWDILDFVRIQYKMDNGAWTTVGAFYGDDPIDGDMREDADLNGIADPAGAILTTALTTFEYSFASTGTTLQVRLVHDSDGNEELAFDNFCITGVQSCDISSLTLGTQSSCVNNEYSQDVVVSYTNAPATGTLDVHGQSFAIGTSPQTVTLSGLVADGNPLTVSASFSDNTACTNSLTFSAPPPCPPNCDGALITTTYTAGSWDMGPPDIGYRAVIDSPLVTGGTSIVACECEVNASLTVQDGDYLRVNGDITVNGTLTVDHQGSVVQVDDNASVTNNGTITVEKITPFLEPRFFMISGSPMTAETREGVYANSRRVRRHVTANFVPNPFVAAAFPLANNFADDNGNNWFFHSGGINPGEGYAVWPQPNGSSSGSYTQNHTLGTLTNGVVDFPMTFNEPGPLPSDNQNASPNVLANPYASAIDADLFFDNPANANINVLYFWEHNTPALPSYPGYAARNWDMADISLYSESLGGLPAASGGDTPTQFISSGQGFAIKPSAGGTAQFNNSMRVTGPNDTYRSNNSVNLDRIWINVYNDAYELGSTALIGFTENTADEFINSEDIKRLATPVSIYSELESGEQLAINALHTFEVEDTFYLSFSTQVEEIQDYRISIDALEGLNIETATVYLIDALTGTVTNLTESDYTFQSGEATYGKRFEVVFENSVLGINGSNLESISLYPNPTQNVVTIVSPQTILTSAAVYDIRGRKVSEVDFRNQTAYQIDLSSMEAAFYFIQIATENGTVMKQVIKR